MTNGAHTELIQAELEEAKKYNFEEIDGPKRCESCPARLVALTRRNVALAKAMIANNSAYMRGDKAKDALLLFGNLLYGKIPFDQNKYKDAIMKAVTAIDEDNPTHLNTVSVGRDQLAQRIIDTDIDTLKSYLEKPEASNYGLIEDLSRKTEPEEGKKASQNLSFASKFCHYACYYIFEGKDEQDNYSIYDAVIRDIFPCYICLYCSSTDVHVKHRGYASFQKVIDCVIEGSGAVISGMDSII